MPTLLVVDDDHDIRDLLGKFLQQHGLKLFLHKMAMKCSQQLAVNNIDLIILDIMMPGKDGLYLMS